MRRLVTSLWVIGSLSWSVQVAAQPVRPVQPVRPTQQTTTPTLTPEGHLPPFPLAEPTASLPEGAPLSLQDVFVRFREANLQVLASRYSIDIARADAITAGLWTNPNILLQGSLLFSGNNTVTSNGGNNQTTVSALADMVLPLAGQPAARRRAAEAAITVAEHQF